MLYKTKHAFYLKLSLFVSLSFSTTYANEDDNFGGFSRGFLSGKPAEPLLQKSPRQALPPSKKIILESTPTPTPPSIFGFGGLAKGFLDAKSRASKFPLPQKQSSCPLPSSSKEIILQSTPISIEQYLFEDELPPSISLWGHPDLLSPKAREIIYECLGDQKAYFKDILEKYFNDLTSPTIEILNNTCHSDKLFNLFLQVWSIINSKQSRTFRSFTVEKEKMDITAFIMQNLANMVINARFQYMKELSGGDSELFKEKFVTKGSNEQQGEFVLDLSLWQDKFFEAQARSSFRYFQQTSLKKGRIYRLYTNSQCIELPNDPTLSLCRHGEIEYSFKTSSIPYATNTSGFILDKMGNHIEKEGLVLTKGWGFPEDYHLFSYDRHPGVDQMFFFQIAPVFSSEEIQDTAFIKTLLEFEGSIEKLNTQKFLYFPSPDKQIAHKIPASVAHLLLPYVYHLKEQQNLVLENSSDSPQMLLLNNTVKELEDILAEDLSVKEFETLTEEATNEIASQEIDESIQREDPTLLLKIQKKQDTIYKVYPKPKNFKTKWKEKHKKTARKEAIQKIQEKSARRVNPDLLAQRRKEKALERIQEKYLKIAAEKKTFASSEAQELLGQMAEEFSNLDIVATGETAIRGSHARMEVKNLDSGKSTKLGLARRSEKRGYQSGTLKTIIKDHVLKALSIVINKNKGSNL